MSWWTSYTSDEEAKYEFGSVEIEQTTARALLVRDTEGSTLDQHDQKWIPISQIHDDSEIDGDCVVGDSGMLVVKRWLAEQEKWL